MASLTEELEDQIAERLRTMVDNVPPESIRGVVDARTAINLAFVSPPALLIEYSGETTEQSSQRVWRSTMDWDVYVIAASFSADGAGRIDTVETPQAPGAYTLLDDVFAALAGHQLPGPGGETPVWMLPNGVESWGVSETHIVYRSKWRCNVTRLGEGAD